MKLKCYYPNDFTTVYVLPKDTLLTIDRFLVGVETPDGQSAGSKWDCTFAEALREGWLSTSGGTADYRLHISENEPRFRDTGHVFVDKGHKNWQLKCSVLHDELPPEYEENEQH